MTLQTDLSRYMKSTYGYRAMPILAKDLDELEEKVASWRERVSWYGCIVNGSYVQGRDALYYVDKFLTQGVWKDRVTTRVEDHHQFQTGQNTIVRANKSDRGADELRKKQLKYIESLTKKPEQDNPDSDGNVSFRTDYSDTYFAPGELISRTEDGEEPISHGNVFSELTDQDKAELKSFADLVHLLRKSKFHLWELYGQTWIFEFNLRPELVEKTKVLILPEQQAKGKGKTGTKAKVTKGDAPHGPIVSRPGRVIGAEKVWEPMTVKTSRQGMHWQGGKIVGNKPFYDGASPRSAIKSDGTQLKQVVYSSHLESAKILFITGDNLAPEEQRFGMVWYEERAKDLDLPDKPLFESWEGEWKTLQLPSMRPKRAEYIKDTGGYIGKIKSRDKNPAKAGPAQVGVGRMRGSLQEGEWEERWHYEVFFSLVGRVFPNDIHRPVEFLFRTNLTFEEGKPTIRLEVLESFRNRASDKEITQAFEEVREFIKPVILRRVRTDNKVIVDGRLYSEPTESSEYTLQKVNPTFLKLVQWHSIPYDPDRDFMDWRERQQSQKRRRERAHKIAEIDVSRKTRFQKVKEIRGKKGKKSKMRGKKRQRLKGLR